MELNDIINFKKINKKNSLDIIFSIILLEKINIKIELVSYCVNIKYLVINNFMLNNIEFISELKNIIILDLSHNNINYVPVLSCDNLNKFCIEGNNISNINDIKNLSLIINLKMLSLKSKFDYYKNPICSNKNYYQIITKYFNNLKMLDYYDINYILKNIKINNNNYETNNEIINIINKNMDKYTKQINNLKNNYEELLLLKSNFEQNEYPKIIDKLLNLKQKIKYQKLYINKNILIKN